MDLPDVKTLTKLAAACRKAGIKDFKGFGFEFTLAESYAPTKAAKAKKTSPKASTTLSEDTSIPVEGWDALSDEDKLLWSVSDAPSGLAD